MEHADFSVFAHDSRPSHTDPRREARTAVSLRVAIADNAGSANGLVYNLSASGCGIQLTKPLLRGQYLWLKLYPEPQTMPPLYDVVRVRWVEEERAGIEFLSLPMTELRQLHRLFGDQISLTLEE